jgi:PleD family two-component response regulator
VRDLNIRHENSIAAPHVTISVGVASAANVIAAATGKASRSNAGEQDLRLAARRLVETADLALYAAKETGRNRAVSAGEARDKAKQSAA